MSERVFLYFNLCCDVVFNKVMLMIMIVIASYFLFCISMMIMTKKSLTGGFLGL